MLISRNLKINKSMMNNYMKLICESDFNNYDVINESNALGHKQLKLKGPMIMANTTNANGRVYSKDLLKPEVDRFIREKISTGSGNIAEFEHPDHEHINPDRACGIITSLTEDGNLWNGSLTILCSDPSSGIIGTPCGDILASIIQHGGKVGCSTRGVGTLSEDGKQVLEYHLTTIDVVLSPSIERFCDGILESKNYIMTAKGDIAEVAYDKFEKNLKTIPHTSRDAYLKNAISKFMCEVNK